MERDVLKSKFRSQLLEDEQKREKLHKDLFGYPEESERLKEYQNRDVEALKRVKAMYEIIGEGYSGITSGRVERLIPLYQLDESEQSEGYIGFGAILKTITKEGFSDSYIYCHAIDFYAFTADGKLMELKQKDKKQVKTPNRNAQILGSNAQERMEYLEKNGNLRQFAQFEFELSILESKVFPDGQQPKTSEELKQAQKHFRQLQLEAGLVV